MGSHKSKEDDVSKISTSIFITNFPVTFSAKDLFNACKQYGHVIDAYIPIKRSKAGKRRSTHVYQKDMGQSGVGNSYVQVVKGNNTSVDAERSYPTLVLDIMFEHIRSLYLDDGKGFKKLFHSNVGVGSWFSQLIQASKDFTIEGRIVWVEIEEKTAFTRKGSVHKRRRRRFNALDSDVDEGPLKRVMRRSAYYNKSRGVVYWSKGESVPRYIQHL
ncbi:nucleotide-binding alpha-beta plait domain-containing protein [Tanacetum coccineum]